MMRVLLVEDAEDDLQAISDDIENEFEGVTLCVARSTGEARDQIKRMVWENARLHIAILDINLPEHSGYTPVPGSYEFSLSQLIRGHFETCLILYYTVFSDREQVKEHIGTDMTHDRLIEKGPGGDERLLEAIRQYWQLQLLAWAKGILRPKPQGSAKVGRLSGPATGPGCSTIQVNTVLHEIGCFHDNFSTDGINEIEKYVKFVKENGHWRAELLLWEAENGDATAGDG
jgi:DNA-binding NarL/FixJ family response regulator